MKLGRPTQTSIHQELETIGMRRVDWVRITVGDGATSAEAIGVGHRHPCTRPLPLPMAARLTADGVPFLVRHKGSD